MQKVFLFEFSHRQWDLPLQAMSRTFR